MGSTVFEWLADSKEHAIILKIRVHRESVVHNPTKQDNMLLIFDLLMFQVVKIFWSDLLCCNIFAIFCVSLWFSHHVSHTTAAKVNFSPEQLIYARACIHTQRMAMLCQYWENEKCVVLQITSHCSSSLFKSTLKNILHFRQKEKTILKVKTKTLIFHFYIFNVLRWHEFPFQIE